MYIIFFLVIMSSKLFALILVSVIILEMCDFGVTWRRRRRQVTSKDAAGELLICVLSKL